MSKIRKLSKNVFQKIAAGEVIERPSSVVKELVENSLDAGADDIRVELLKGGKGLIQITDNGCGMSREDARLCFESHATSKISREDDLQRISTLGFRGEALASISAVSRVMLKTSEEGGKKGTLLIREGGELLKEADIAFPRGTSLEVKDLFFNLPARKKFLRSERAELNRVIKYMTNAALSYPEVKFFLKHGSRKVFDYPAVKNLKERIFQVHGSTLLEGLVKVDFQDEELRLLGFTSRPPSARGDRRLQIFFVNNRPVRDNTLQAALNQAYRGLLEKGQFAAAFLFLEVPLTEVDVNVHPAKAEVRFRDNRSIFQFIYRSIGNAVMKELGVKEIYTEQKEGKEPAYRIQERKQPPFLYHKEESLVYSAKPFPVQEEEKAGPHVLGQYLNFYIIAADDKGIFIIDQHNAHERVLFEKYQQIDRGEKWPCKMALTPLLFEFSPSQVVSLEENRELLEETGFRVDSMGGTSYALKEYPDIFKESEAKAVFFSILEGVGLEKIEKKKHLILATMACKTAIKAGESLSLEKMAYLVEELFKTENSALCPHGRPIVLRITKQEIEKGLKR